MKYIKLFETHSLYEAYIADTVNFVRPNVSYCEDYSHVHYNNLLEISSALITCDSAIYNGETQIATNIVVMSGSVVLTNNTDYVVINNNGGINAGSYTFTIRGIGNYKGYKNGTFIINKMTPTVVAPTAKVLTYNGSAQELINAGSTNAGTLQYKVDDGSWSTNIPTGINGGSYNVLYKVVGNNNVNDVEALSILCSINEKEVTATVELSLDTYTYSGNAYEPTVTVKDVGTIIPSSEYTVTYSNNINAGTATVTIIDNTGGNYAVIGSTTFTIEKATGSVTTIPVNKAVTYNESAQIVADAGAGTGTMMYRLGDSGDFSSSMPTATNAGTYTLYFYAAESANYLQSATQNIEVTISKAIPSYTSPQGKDNLIYSGESQELLIEGSSPDGIIKYSSDGGETWTTDIPEGINVVTYHLQWKVFGDSNHTDSTPINIDVSIAKVTPTVTAPTIVSNLEYTGAAQNLLNNDGSTNFGTLQYSSDNENFSTTIPTGTNAGSYDIWYRVQGDSNVNDVPSVKLTNSIAKVDACYVAPTAATGLVYDETSQALLNAGSSTCGIVLYSSDETNWSTNIPEGTNAGDYTSYWRVVADSNHIDKPSASIITNIDKAAGEIYTAPTPITGLIYNDTALSLITSGSGTGTMQYKVDSGSWESSIPTMINAGTYTIYYKVLESSNYYATDGTDYITTTIAKVTPTVTAPTPRVLTYNTSSLALVNAGSTDWGTLQYSLDNSTWSTNIPEAINYGSYTVHYRVVGNSNINNVPSDSVSCSIAEKRVSTPTIELDPTGYTYSGNQCKPSVIVKDGSHVIPSSEYTVTYSNNINAGTATVVISDNTAGNYNITGTKDFTISKAPGEVTTKPTAKSLTYTGNSQELINAGSGTGTMYYRLGTSGSFSTEIPSATNAGTYTVYFYAAESNNYLQSTPTESVNNITIIEKSISIPTPTGYSAQYDGNAHTATFGSATGASITKYRYSTNNSTWTESSSNPSITNVGTLYTQAYYSANTDYTGSGWSSSAILSVSRKTNASASAASGLVYNGTTESNGTALTGVSGSNVSWSGTTSATNAGSYTAYATPNSNYAWSDGTYALKTISWSIAKRGQGAPTLLGDSKAYHNTASASVKTAGTIAGGTATCPGTLTWSNQSRTTLGSLTATAYYAATTNFSASSTSAGVTVQITQASDASVSVTLSGTLNYSRGAQTIATATSHGCTYLLALGSNESSVPSSGWTNSSLTATNAGTYYIWYKGTPDSNHSNTINATYKGSVTINKVTPVLSTSPSNTSPTYNGLLQYLLTGGSMKHSSSDSTAVAGTFGYDGSTDAGTYTNPGWYFTPTDTTNYNSTHGKVTTPTTIAKQSLSNVTITLSWTSRNYNGSAQVPTVTVKSGSTTLTPGAHYNLSYTNSSSQNAGTYSITANASSNYSFTAVSANYTINKIDPTYSAPTAKSGLTYNGSALTLYNAGSNTTPGSFSYTNGSGTNAATNYSVGWTFTPTDTTNYNTKSGTLTGVIAQKEVTLSWGTRSWTYDKSAHSTTCTAGSLVSGTSCTVNLTGNSITNVGSTTVTASSLSNSNYKLPSAKTTTISIVARTVTLSWGTLSWTYDKSAHSTTCTAGNLCSGDSCTVTLTGNSITNVGTTTVTASSLSNSNYTLPSTKTATLTINAREVTLTWGTTSWTYDKSAHSTTCTAGNLCSGDSCTVTLTNNSITNVGSTTVTASSLSNSNYKLPSSKTKSISVSARTVTLSWGTTSWIYDGSAHSTSCTAGNVCSGDTCTVTLSGNSITNKGTTTVTASSLSNSNYALPSSKTATLTMFDRSVTYTANNESWTYDGSSHSASNTATLTAGSLVSGHTATFSCSGSVGPNAGSSTKTLSSVTIKSGSTDVSNNYSIAKVNGTLTINKANQTITFDSSTGSVDVGSSLAKLATRSVGDGTVTYSSSNTSIATFNSSTGVVTGVSEGTCTITATAASTTNYNSASASYTLTVTKKDLLITTTLTNASYWGFINGYATLTLTGALGSITSRSSSNTSVATIDSNNVITIKGKGTATITINVSATTVYKAATVTYTVTLSYRDTFVYNRKYYELSDGHLWSILHNSGDSGTANDSQVLNLLNSSTTGRYYNNSSKTNIIIYDKNRGSGVYFNLYTLDCKTYGHTSEKVAVISTPSGTLEITDTSIRAVPNNRYSSNYHSVYYLA